MLTYTYTYASKLVTNILFTKLPTPASRKIQRIIMLESRLNTEKTEACTKLIGTGPEIIQILLFFRYSGFFYSAASLG